jgi:GNAT superfamily N-acetyltransferase
VILRLAEPSDVLAVARVHVRAWQVGYRGLMPHAYLDGLRPEDRAARYTFGVAGTPVTVVAIEGDRIVGFATTYGAELAALNVDPDRWRSGVGRALITDACDRLAAAGNPTAFLWVLAGNTRAESFYLREGWKPDGERRTAEVWGISVDELRYSTELATSRPA